MLQKTNILIVEDDENLRLALQDNLESAGYSVLTAATGTEARDQLQSQAIDLVVLDIMLPDTDGYQLCRELRASERDCAVLMLTARTLEDDIVQGFEAGADDFLAKPYRLRELLARVQALLRRSSVPPPEHLTFAGFQLDLTARTLRGPDAADIDLTQKEFDTLAYLVQHRNRALTRDQILEAIWGDDVAVTTRTIDNFISSLKKKLRWSEESEFRILSLRGVGYRMEFD